MVQVIDTTTTDAPVDDDTVSFEDAMATLGIDRSALRKRLNRGSTVERVITDNEVRVRFLETDDS